MFKKAEPSDARLVQEALSGRQESYSALVLRYLPAVHALTFAQTGNHSDAEDVAQETFLKAYRSLDTLRDKGQIGGWVAAIGKNKARSFFRKKQRRAEAPLEGIPDGVEPDLETRDLRRILKRQIEGLDERHREVLLLHYFAGMKAREIGQLLGVSKFAVQKRLQRARDALGKKVVDVLGAEMERHQPRETQARKIMGLVAAAGAPWAARGAQASVLAGLLRFGGALATKKLVIGLSILAVTGLAFVFDRPPSTMESNAFGSLDAKTSPVQSPAPVQPKTDGVEEVLQEKGAAPEPPDALAPVASPGGMILGTIYYKETNKPIIAAKLNIDAIFGGDSEHPKKMSVISNSEGRFSLLNIKAGVYHFRSFQLGALMERKIGEVAKVEEGEIVIRNLPINSGAFIAGKVVDEEGDPLVGVKVEGITNQENRYRHNYSDPYGLFEISGFESAGKGFRVQAWKEGYALAPLDGLVVPEEGLRNLLLTMAPESTVSGVVVDAMGAPLSDVGVTVRNLPGNPYDYPKNRSKEDGTFKLTGMYEGSFQAMITSPESNSFSFPAKTFDIGRGEHLTGLVLVLEQGKGLDISGRVIDTEGRPLSYVFLILRGAVTESASSDERGRYKFTGLPEGEYHIAISERGLTGTRENVPAGSENVDFILPAYAVIRGNVVDAATGAAVTEFEIAGVNGVYEQLHDHLSWQLKAVRSENGRFELAKVAPGDATVCVRAKGYAQKAYPITGIEPGGHLRGVRILLDAGRAITGMVQGTDGNPLSGARIYLGALPDQQYLTHAIVTATDADGMFTVHIAPGAIQTLTAYHSGYAPCTVRIPVARSKLHIVLTGGGVVTGVLSLDGTPLSGRTVTLYRDGSHFGSIKTGDDGAYHFDRVQPGLVEIRGYLPDEERMKGWRRITREAVVQEGKTTEVQLTAFRASTAIEGTVLLNGKPQGNASLYFDMATPSGTVKYTCSTNNDGSYSVAGLPSGSGTIEISCYGEDTTIDRWNLDIDLVKGQTVHRDFELTQ